MFKFRHLLIVAAALGAGWLLLFPLLRPTSSGADLAPAGGPAPGPDRVAPAAFGPTRPATGVGSLPSAETGSARRAGDAPGGPPVVDRAVDRRPATAPEPAAAPRTKDGGPDPQTMTAAWRARRGRGPSIVEDEPPAVIGLGADGSGLLAAVEPRPEEPVDTSWSVGDSWRVVAYYRNMASTSDAWSRPLVWDYRVVGTDTLRDHEVLDVEVELAGDAAGRLAPAHFYITRDRQLIAFEATHRQGGEDRPVFIFYDDDPSAAASGNWSIIPFDLPAAGATGRLEPAGALRFDPLPASIVARFPEPSRWVGGGGDYLAVEFENRLDHSRIRQLWSPTDRRWPVASFTPSRRSYRLRGQE